MNVVVGAGPRPIGGWLNIEPRPASPAHTRGHAGRIPVADSTVDVLFANAVLEHIYQLQVPAAVREWRRVITDTGTIVVLGVPDFEMVARLYLDKAPGVRYPTFDLSEVYRYTHGLPEGGALFDWSTWDPADHLDDAPPEWLPQLHKFIYDAALLRKLFEACGLHARLIRYCYPQDTQHPLNLGVFAGRTTPKVDLDLVPEVDEYVNRDSVVEL